MADNQQTSLTYYESVNTNGHVTVTADAISTNGETVIASSMPISSTSELRYDLRKTSTSYVLKGAKSGPVNYYTTDNWNTSEAAKSYLKSQYGSIAELYGGSATVTVDHHSYVEKDGQPRIDVEYTVEYSGLEDAVAESLATSLERSQDVSLSESEIDAITEDATALEIDHVTFEMTQELGETRVDWDAKVNNYDEAMSSALTVAQNSEQVNVDQKTIDRIKTGFEAQRAADMKQTVEWSAEMTQEVGGNVEMTANVSYRTENWEAYASEMERRGVDLGSSSFEFHAQSEGEDVTAEASVELEQKQMLSQMTDAMVSSLDSQSDAEALAILRAFEQSEFQTARMDVNVGEGTVTVEGGAKFDNLSSLSTAMGDSYGGMNVASVVGRTNGSETTTYVRGEGLVGEDATEEDVRALAVADAETTIYLAGEWDREFPSMDTANVSSYLGVEQQNADADSKTGGQPGFGIAAAIVALTGVALLARRD
ncbi:PGF-CTERM sorting domain-containing protein [Haladaptatus sp. NG-WS-4]